MKHLLALAVLAILGTAMGAAQAEEKLISPSEFRAFSQGYTLYFDREGEAFGSESFGPDGNVVWRYNDGSCVKGAWRPHGAQLCFLYEGEGANGEVLCWRMLRTEKGDLIARLLQGDNAGLELQVTGRDKKPLLCGDPGTAT